MEAVTHRRVLKIAVPVVISNVTVPLLGLVDTAVIGQMGQAAPIGAVGLGAVVLTMVYWIFGFLRMGTSGLAAQALGRGDLPECRSILLRGLMMGGLAGLAIVALQLPLTRLAFALSPASAEVEALARSYLSIRVWGAPATIMLYAITGWLIALERTRAVLALQVLMNGANILLALLFVLHLECGIEGVAVATLLAEIGGLALGLWLCREGLRGLRAPLFTRAPWAQMMSANRDIMIRSVLVQGSFTAFLFFGAGLGDVTLAANQVLMQLLSVTSYALDGFAFAAEALVGQAVGARNRAALRRAAVISGQWATGGGLALGLAWLFAGGLAVDLMTTAPDVREAARVSLPWLAVLPILSAACYIFDGIFIGALRTREMRDGMILAFGVYLAALAIFLPLWGVQGLWLSLLLFNAARGAVLALWYPRVEASAA